MLERASAVWVFGGFILLAGCGGELSAADPEETGSADARADGGDTLADSDPSDTGADGGDPADLASDGMPADVAPDLDDRDDASLPGEDPAVDTASDGASGDSGAEDGAGSNDGDSGLPVEVDNTTLLGKLLVGYQGWFGAQGDESELNNWRHWSSGGQPNADNVTFDAWPDLREYPAELLYATSFDYPDGRPAGLFSSYDAAVVRLHFEWMRDYGIDGVFLQQFVSELGEGSAIRAFRDRVQENALAAAAATGRVLVVMYDISGAPESTWVETIQAHWQLLVDSGATASDVYLHHQGRPLVAVWGPGFTDRPGTPAQTQALIDWFHGGAEPQYRATIMGGVPTHWRELSGDSKSDPDWAGVYLAYDVLSPWTVGRYANDADVQSFRANLIVPDMAACAAAGVEYMPVVWPGFSWANLFEGQPLNQIPRRGGRFFWRQVYEFVNAGADMLYVAMFDEVDEGTAMFKVAENAAQRPTTGTFLTLDADGEAIPSDFYLRLAGEAGRVLRGERVLGAERPIAPPLPTCNPPHTELVGDRCLPSCGAAGGNSCDEAECSGRTHLESYDCEVCCFVDP